MGRGSVQGKCLGKRRHVLGVLRSRVRKSVCGSARARASIFCPFSTVTTLRLRKRRVGARRSRTSSSSAMIAATHTSAATLQVGGSKDDPAILQVVQLLHPDTLPSSTLVGDEVRRWVGNQRSWAC